MTTTYDYRSAVIYQLSVQSFADSNADGIGDLPGLIARLDYLKDLGVGAVWILPFYPSPRLDDGYDVTDFQAVDPAFGALDDFRRLVDEAHKRELRVLTELVLNHTSDRHPWFQRARRALPGTDERDFYIWRDMRPAGDRDLAAPDRTGGADGGADDEVGNWTWDPVARAFYWHRFYRHEPNLNFRSPGVREAMAGVVDFWLEAGADGIALAGVPWLVQGDGPESEIDPEVHAYLKEIRRRVDGRFPDRVLLAEPNAWPEDAAEYFGDGDECHVTAHFAMAPRLFMSIRMEDRFPLVDILRQTPPVPEGCGWALFLRNHDELTLEMVTDEERDYMHRVYAADPQTVVQGGIRRRLAPLLGNNRRLIELVNALLFTLPGAPVLYYGDEIGMGDNIYLPGRQGLRTPMQWAFDRNAGFSEANPQRLYTPVVIDPAYHYETVNVEAQQANPSSLLWWMKRLIDLRRRYPALTCPATGGAGFDTLEFLASDNRKVLTYVRRCRGAGTTPARGSAGSGSEDDVLVVANLSRFVEYVELDLSQLAGRTPVELIGRREFPPVADAPYFLTLGPHSFYLFALRQQQAAAVEGGSFDVNRALVLMRGGVSKHWTAVLEPPARSRLEVILPAYIRPRRWFRSKTREIRRAIIVEHAPLTTVDAEAPAFVVTLVRVEYAEGDPETYILPLAYAPPEAVAGLLERTPQAAIAYLMGDGDGEAAGLIYDALWDPAFSALLMDAVAEGREFPGAHGTFAAEPTGAFTRVRGPEESPLVPRLSRVEQSNTSVIFGDRLIMKIFRRIEEGVNPDLEVPRFLTEHTDFASIAPVAGALEYRTASAAERMSVGIVQGFVRNEGDAWAYTLDLLGGFVERARAHPAPPPEGLQVSTGTMLEVAQNPPADLARQLIGPYLSSAALLGQRTAEMHLGLAVETDDPAFAAEPFTRAYQRSLYQSMRTQVVTAYDLLRRRLTGLPDAVRDQARQLLSMEDPLLRRLRTVSDRPVQAARIRTHGDYHLGQVLYTGDDFVIIDFEGEPSKPLNERRYKRSPLRDVAGMLRSFQYAAYGKVLFDEGAAGVGSVLEGWGRFWQLHVCAAFLGAYLRNAGGAIFLPHDRAQLLLLLDAYLLEKAAYELAYELNNRPDWVTIPVQSMLQLLTEAG